MSSDDPIEPIHGIEKMETTPARGLREKSYHLFSRLLENTLIWKRFQLSNDLNKSKFKRKQNPEEPPPPEDPSGFDTKA
jgi:hypothetical protein